MAPTATTAAVSVRPHLFIGMEPVPAALKPHRTVQKRVKNASPRTGTTGCGCGVDCETNNCRFPRRSRELCSLLNHPNHWS